MNEEEKFITGKDIKKKLLVSDTTLHRWVEQNKIRAIRTPSGVRRYYLTDIQNILNRNVHLEEKQKIVYCRVSSSKQMDDLGRQTNFFRQEYPNHQLVTDIGSGINWKRKGLKTILELAMQGNISEVVVAHRDRLCRFAFELLEWIFSKHGVKLVVLDQTENQSSETELANDILSIIHVFSCKQMGRRRYSSKQTNPSVSNEQTEKTISSMDGDKTICI